MSTNNGNDESDLLDLPDETPERGAVSSNPPWKILIVDDEGDVHAVTKLALYGFTFRERGLAFNDAYEYYSACQIMAENPDTAVILLDVVMETRDAGLRVIKHVRNELGNHLVRIILRTGQPGEAPEQRVIVDYDINDYKCKTELTSQKLFSSLVSALRSYGNISDIENSRRGLLKMLEATNLSGFDSMAEYISGLLMQFGSLREAEGHDAMMVRKIPENGENALEIVAALGKYESAAGEEASRILEPAILENLHLAFKDRSHKHTPDHSVFFIPSASGRDKVIYVTGKGEFKDAELALAEKCCASAALALDDFDRARILVSERNALLDEMVRLSEPDSCGGVAHARRVAALSRKIADRLSEMGLFPGEAGQRLADLIYPAAMLHDIGNSKIPATLLTKAGLFDASEKMSMQDHAEQGYEHLSAVSATVKNCGFLGMAADIALHHHESYDGQGYPRGLAGDAIPLAARIIALADAYDALVSARPHRKAYSQAEALEIIRQESGTHFDPRVADAFFDVAETACAAD
jgi:HD-GYP domain-containing protein (c-di-GMP phosphodiesterase class II)/CheY-like chemotaxis protein